MNMKNRLGYMAVGGARDGGCGIGRFAGHGATR